jgi:chemotaxis protein CheD
MAATASVIPKRHLISLGEWMVSQSPEDVLVANGLGSCIGLVLYDPSKRIGAMAHIVLPAPPETLKTVDKPGLYASLVVPLMFDKLQKMGCKPELMSVRLAGGSQMTSSSEANTLDLPSINVGLRNVIAVKAALKNHNILPPAKFCHTGGNAGRNLRLEMESGKCYLQVIGGADAEW